MSTFLQQTKCPMGMCIARCWMSSRNLDDSPQRLNLRIDPHVLRADESVWVVGKPHSRVGEAFEYQFRADVLAVAFAAAQAQGDAGDDLGDLVLVVRTGQLI